MSTNTNTSAGILALLDRLGKGTLSPEDQAFLVNHPAARAALSKVPRSQLLPMMFKIHGQPYSLDNFVQFKTLFDEPYVPDVLVMSGRQVSKSTCLSRFEVMNCLQIPHYQILYVAPLQGQAHHYSTMYLREAISTCAIAQEMQRGSTDVGGIAKSVAHQSFANGSGIKMTYAKTSADRARGIFADEIDCDEIQDHLIDNISVIMQSLTQSKWGLRRYTGTAKTMDNTIEFYWQKSSQAEWVIKCAGCGYWNIPNKDGNVIDMIQTAGPSCVKCGKVLPIRKGGWVHKFPDRVKSFAGYHVPQIVVPNIAEDPKKWDELLGKVLRYPVTSTYQEILGISSSTGARLITQEDIDKHATLPCVEERIKQIRTYPLIVGGVDWGVAEQTSFTVHTILGICRDGKMHVLWAKRYAGIDTDTLMKDIAQTHRFYGCQLIACDFGMGFAQNTMLTHRFGLPVIQIQYTRQQRLMTSSPILGFPRWTVDKVTALELLFWAIRYGRIWFPPKEESDVYTQDLLSPYEEVNVAGGIESRMFSRNPNMPDDFAHALCFAMLGALRMTGSSLMDAVPVGGMGADDDSVAVPVRDHIDPREVLRAM